MTKSATFGNRLGIGNVNTGFLDITGITVTEDSVGTVNSFLGSSGLTLTAGPVPTFLSPYAGLRWTSFGSGALAPGSSTTVTFNYNVTATDGAKGINELQQSFTIDTLVGSGLSLQAVETVYDTNNNVVGRITTNITNPAVPNTGGILPGVNDFQMVAAYSSLRVEVTLTASVAADAPAGSAVNISILNNGYRQTTLATQARLGDYVWEDTNRNGVQDSGEAGIAGVTVKLTNASGSLTYMTTTTDATGKYEFANLNAGNYVVEFVKPADYAFTGSDLGGNDAADSDASATTGRTGVISLAAGQVNTTIDAGLVKLLKLGDRVWLDSDADGIQDGGEAGLAGVTVTLTSLGTDGIEGTLDDVVVGTKVTDGSGNYLFTGLTAGKYVANFDAPSGYLFSAAEQGGNTAADSNANSIGGTGVITLTADDLTIDAGVYQTASLGDFVWNDANNNGVQDSGEAGVEGVTVKLLDGSGIDTGISTVTDVNGQYLFDGLTPGSYSVQFLAPSGYAFSTADQGGNDGTDSDANATTGTTASVTLSSGEENITLDAGLVRLLSLGNYTWIDADADGIQDSGEAALAGVSVTLTNLGTDGVLGGGDDSVVGTQVTDTNGAYLFSGLRPGSYALQFTAPGGYVVTAAGQGGDAALDSNINVSGATGVVTLTSDDLTIDAGFYKLATLGDRIFNDVDKDGIQDPGETGIEGITVSLLDGDGAATGRTTVTDANGLYLFDNLVPGSYAVSISPGLDYVVSPANAGGDDAKDSDANALGITNAVTLASGDDNRTLDIGVYVPGSGNTAVLKLGDFVWSDSNANGVQDLGEGGIAGVGVQLINLGGDGALGTLDDTTVGTTTTDTMGKYLFSNLAPGSYAVRFTAPGGYLYSPSLAGGNTGLDSNPLSISGATGTTGTIVLTNADDLSIDAGLYQTASLGDFVWNDANNNGVQDSGEAGVAGVTVKLLDGSGNDTGKFTTTDGTGGYSFTGLTPGSYSVQFLAPSGYAFSKADQGGNDSTDSDANATTGTTASVTLTSGQNNTTLDAGLVKLLSLGDYTWIDADADGVQDGDEVALAGVSVTLTNLGANGVLGGGDDSVVGTQVTGTNGAYLFSGLRPGNYALQFTAPSGYIASPSGQGGDAALDSNINSAGATGVVTLTNDDITIDAGFYKKASLGDFVWKDTNNNGVQDSGEAGFSGVTVRLLDENGVFTGLSTVTNSSGGYQFTNLMPGEYGIQVVAPSGWVFTSTDSGTDDTRDSDVNASGVSSTVVLRSGDFNRTLDAGLSVYCPPPPVKYKLGDRVWVDSNGNGLQDTGENGLACVSVKLINVGSDGVLGGGNDVVVGTTTTDSYGKYLFSNLNAGNYVVQFTAPSGYSFTTALAGTNTSIDSNPNSISGSIGTTQTIVLNADNLTVDAGLYKPACIGNFVFLDCDKDGIQDCGEDGVAGVTVKLFSGTGVDLNRSTVTDANGYYSFGGLAPGSYQVQFVAPAGYSFTAQDRGTNDAVDSDANSSGRTGTYTLVSGQNNTTVDAGLIKNAATFVQARGGLTPGFWGQRLEVWDGDTCNDGKASNLVASGVLRKTDVMAGVANDCWGRGILLGDANANGYTDTGETTLFVPLAAAQQLIRSSDSNGDARQILMKHAIAAQLNIYNGAGSPGLNANDGIVGAEMITLATKWLRGMQLDSNSGMQFVYPDGTSGSVDRRGTSGVLNTGTTNGSNVDYNTSTATFNSTRLANSSGAWNTDVDADPTSAILRIDGDGIKNVLDAYNNNKLVMSADFNSVAWKNGTSYLGALDDSGLNYLRVAANNGVSIV